MTAHVISQARSRKVLDVFLTIIGELLLTAGLLIGLFLVWQLWWTSIDANAKAEQTMTQIHNTLPTSPKKAGNKHTEAPPVEPTVAYGQPMGVLIVPKWYGITNNNMPIYQGTGQELLDQAAAGHYQNTAYPGAIGNFSVAGHRRTNGNSFRRIDLLKAGDEVIVETATAWYVYKVTGHEIVDPSQVDVIAPVPNNPNAQPTQRLLTMTTCHSATLGEWGNDQRWIVHAQLSYWIPRGEGRPESVLSDPGVK